MKLSLSLVSKKVAQLIADGQKEEAVNLLAGFIFLNKKQKDVDLILDLLSAGQSFESILEEYNSLELKDIYACLAYASKLTRIKTYLPAA